VAALYAEGQRHIDAAEWQQALECFEEVQRLEPGFNQTEELLSRVRRELTPPPTVEVPDLSGQTVSQAASTLAGQAMAGRGLKLGAQSEAPSNTVSAGRIVKQSPKAGTEVDAGSLVNVTVSLGSDEEPSILSNRPQASPRSISRSTQGDQPEHTSSYGVAQAVLIAVVSVIVLFLVIGAIVSMTQ
jgi:PASTA domain